MIINHNISALNTYRQMGTNQNAATSAMEKLSSGLRINKAADDAAGLSISEKMRGQIRGLDQASRNAQDGISLVQTAEGALSETQDILQRMRELSVQASNGTYQKEDLAAIQEEVDVLKTEITRIGKATEFNGQTLLDGGLGNKPTLSAGLTVANGINGVSLNGTDAGTYTLSLVDSSGDTDITITDANGVSQTLTAVTDPAAGSSKKLQFDAFDISIEVNSGLNAGISGANNGSIDVATGGVDIQIGANNKTEQKLNIGIDDMQANALGVGGSTDQGTWSVDDININNFSAGDSKASIDVLDKAINEVSSQRSKLGASQNRLEHTINNLNTSSENLTASESRIRDVDMAKEMMTMTKENIKTQAAQAMLAQANQAPQQVLQLLR